MSPDQDSASATTAAPVPWVTSQRELEERARPQRTRYVKVRMRPGVWRVALATQLHAATGQAGGPREHLYRVTLQWLAELDTRDGRAERVSDTMSAHRATNTLQFRVLETIAPDGTRRTYARLGPRGQIAAEPRSHGIMGFLRGILVEWVAAEHPEATLIPGTEPRPENAGALDITRRDGFLARAGFTLVVQEDGGVTYGAPSIASLRSAWNTEKVVELPPAAVAEAFGHQNELPVMRKQLEALEAQVAGLDRERRAAEVMTRVWLAITVLAVVFGIVFGIQPHAA